MAASHPVRIALSALLCIHDNMLLDREGIVPKEHRQFGSLGHPAMDGCGIIGIQTHDMLSFAALVLMLTAIFKRFY